MRKKPRILLVEDELLIADLVETFVEDAGCEVVGPYGTVCEALEACQHVKADAAIVDLVLHGEFAYPVAEMLAKRGIPFGFASGREAAATSSEWLDRPYMGKPFFQEDVDRLLSLLLHGVREPSLA
jgi:DNA-binding response OmpR family regulator